MPVEVPVDGRVIVTALLFTEDLHRQHLDSFGSGPRCLSRPPNVTIL
jgi:hypothetical protein